MLCLSVVAVSACDITLYPEDTITPGSYFRNEADLQLFTNNFYTALPSATDIYTDEADIIINSSLDEAISGQRTIPETGGGWSWTALRQINYYLENSYRCPDEEARKHYDGIARFFRAHFYFIKVARFGDVPWYDQVVGSGDADLLNKPRDSRKYVMDKVLADLDYAIENIRTNKDVYRVTKWAALALKSRIMLFEGTFRKYHNLGDWEVCLQECVKASEQLMKEGGFSLYAKGSTPYATLFNTLDATETSEEVILARDYSEGVKLSHSVQTYTASPTAGCTGVTRRLVDAYLIKDGSRHTDRANYDKLGFIEECKNRDPRMAQTLRTPGYVVNGKLTPANLFSIKLGYQLRKYYISDKYDGFSYVDLPVFRLAEVLLNFAEAKAELGIFSQADADKTINALRKRAGITGTYSVGTPADEWLKACYPTLASLNPNNIGDILEIRRERTVELVMEGRRYHDIIRWKEGKVFEKEFVGMYIAGAGQIDIDGDGNADFNIVTKNNSGVSILGKDLKVGEHLTLVMDDTYNGESGFLTVFRKDIMERKWNEERDYFYPIPRKERVLTNGVLTQNPGWEDGLEF